MFRTNIALLLLLVLLLGLISGCGSGTASVSGAVTYNGEPVGNGFITFLPADGKGPSAGGQIEDGRFAVDNLIPGQKVVKVEAVKKVPFARNSEDMAKRSAANRFLGDGSGLIDPADVIPPNAEGNNEKVDIQPGSQIRDFHLKKAAGKKSR
ncbi:MAG TPA: hypothetical protein VKU02_05735 [Gemmataceae bacterium]|nr:hypothetical protein [Gemmataceae bacterium]